MAVTLPEVSFGEKPHGLSGSRVDQRLVDERDEVSTRVENRVGQEPRDNGTMMIEYWLHDDDPTVLTRGLREASESRTRDDATN